MAETTIVPPEAKRVLEKLYSDILHWRPTKGSAEDGYWHLRYWCEQNDYNIGELFNALAPVIAYYALNFTVDTNTKDRHGKPIMAIILSAGTIPIPRTTGKTGRRPTHAMFEKRQK